MKYELREMVRAGHGAIVNTTSVAGFLPEVGEGAYVAAKSLDEDKGLNEQLKAGPAPASPAVAIRP
jgi:short-subunit dehydrogenase